VNWDFSELALQSNREELAARQDSPGGYSLQSEINSAATIAGRSALLYCHFNKELGLFAFTRFR
jgi:hypothetical protein